jgi:SPP1 family predicted phage head-tail adaptor
MNINNMRHKIYVKQAISVRDAFGAETITYETVFKLKAEVKYISGSKGVDANEIFTSNNIQFITHYRAVKEDMIIVWNNKKYRINFIQEINYKEGLIITTELINE